MTSVVQAREEIRRRAAPLPAESVPLASAHGRILREAVAAAEDMPPFDRSAMDGYALRGDDPAREWKIVGEIRAGEMIAPEIGPGEAVRIFTGARLPAPGLRVVMQEDAEVKESRLRLLRPPGASPHVRRRAEDAAAGEVLLRPGARLDAAAVALLAAVGKTDALVSRAPRVLHLTTGDEIVPPGQPLAPGQVRNSNAFLIGALCREWGAGAVAHFHAPDRLEEMLDVLARADVRTHDLVLISGGSGAGRYDFTAELFRHLGAEICFRQVDVRPGKPLIFGASSAGLVFGLPGNALSHHVCFHLFVRAALARLLGRVEEAPAAAFLAEPLEEALNNRETWWPAQTSQREGRVEARPLPWKSSGDITRLPGADALIHVPAGTARLSAGARIDYLSTGGKLRVMNSKRKFSHVDARGAAAMVDVGKKEIVFRRATARGRLICAAATIRLLKRRALPKGDVLAVARIAAIQAVKRTAELIPLCHPLPIHQIGIEFRVLVRAVEIECTVATEARTGVEMEALVGVSVAALTLYDMCKAVDKGMSMAGIRVVEKIKKAA